MPGRLLEAAVYKGQSFAISRDCPTGLQLLAQPRAIQALSDQHQSIPPQLRPHAAFQRKAFAGEVEDVPFLPCLDPQNALGTIDVRGEMVEKVLEAVKVPRSLTTDHWSKR